VKIKPFLVTLFCFLHCGTAIATPQLMQTLAEEKTKCENDASIFLALYPSKESYIYGSRLYTDVQSAFDGQIEALRVAIIKHTNPAEIPIDNALENKITSFHTYVAQLTAPIREHGNSSPSGPLGGGVSLKTVTNAVGICTALIPTFKAIIEEIRTSNNEERKAILTELDRLRMRPLMELKADPNLKPNQPTTTTPPQINPNPVSGPWPVPLRIQTVGDHRQFKNRKPQQ
jgi:hypothetical protein